MAEPFPTQSQVVIVDIDEKSLEDLGQWPWPRTLVADQPMRITFHLLDDPRSGVLTSDHAPIIDGRRVIYRLEAGEALSLHDGRATIDLLSLNSFVGVDAIEVEALPRD